MIKSKSTKLGDLIVVFVCLILIFVCLTVMNRFSDSDGSVLV